MFGRRGYDASRRGYGERAGDPRADIMHDVAKRRSKIEQIDRAKKGGKTGGVGRKKNSLSVAVSDKLSKTDTRRAAAKEARVPNPTTLLDLS